MTTLNGYQTEVNSGTENGNASNSGMQFSARMQSNMTLPQNFTLQLTGNYNSPFVMAQGRFVGMTGMDIGLRKDFLHGLFNAALSVSDVFNTQQFEVFTSGSNFEQHAVRKRETRIVMLTLTTRFGNLKPDASRRKPTRNDSEGTPTDGGGGM